MRAKEGDDLSLDQAVLPLRPPRDMYTILYRAHARWPGLHSLLVAEVNSTCKDT
jgi:hypothetical protein